MCPDSTPRIPSKPGYDPEFLGADFQVPLPEFGPELIDFIVEKPTLRDGTYADYVNYTIAQHRVQRTAVFAALNIDQTQFKTVSRSNNWRIDSRIGAEFQLNNDYYRSNPWDRGHLARRSTAAWGATSREAKHASDDTFFYANASLQHANFNQDEWLELEDWVKDLTEDDTNRINSISGPIFGDNPRSITPAGRETALIPAAYFKVVTFVAGGALQVRAFIMAQDAAALQDKQGRRMFDNQRYQVTVTEIEERTGLIFPKEVPDNNPLFFNEDAEKAEQLHISQFPERIEVDTPKEVVAKDTERDFVIDTGDVRIVAAMVNPEGDERRGEWVTILNLSGDRVDLAGWTLSDTLRQPYDLEGQIPPGEALRVTPVTPLMLGNRGGTIALFDNQKRRIDRVRYFANDARPEGVPVSFIDRAEPIAPAV